MMGSLASSGPLLCREAPHAYISTCVEPFPRPAKHADDMEAFLPWASMMGAWLWHASAHSVSPRLDLDDLPMHGTGQVNLSTKLLPGTFLRGIDLGTVHQAPYFSRVPLPLI